MFNRNCIVIGLLVCVPALNGWSQVTDYLNQSSRPAWEDAAGIWATIDFTGWPIHTQITNQYSHLGVEFTNDHNFILNGFALDGWALSNGWANLTDAAHIDMEFAMPQNFIAIDTPNLVRILLYREGVLFHTSGLFSAFGGVVSTEPFDKAVVLRNITDAPVNINNLYFGPPIPAPGALAMLGLAAVFHSQRRRRQ